MQIVATPSVYVSSNAGPPTVAELEAKTTLLSGMLREANVELKTLRTRVQELEKEAGNSSSKSDQEGLGL